MYYVIIGGSKGKWPIDQKIKLLTAIMLLNPNGHLDNFFLLKVINIGTVKGVVFLHMADIWAGHLLF